MISDELEHEFPLQSVHFCRRTNQMIMVSTGIIYKSMFTQLAEHRLGEDQVPDYFETLIFSLHDDGEKNKVLGGYERCYCESAAVRQWNRVINRARRNVWTPEKRKTLRKQQQRRRRFEQRQKLEKGGSMLHKRVIV